MGDRAERGLPREGQSRDEVRQGGAGLGPLASFSQLAALSLHMQTSRNFRVTGLQDKCSKWPLGILTCTGIFPFF